LSAIWGKQLAGLKNTLEAKVKARVVFWEWNNSKANEWSNISSNSIGIAWGLLLVAE